MRPSLLGNGLALFPFDTKGTLVYNSGVAQKSQWMVLIGQIKERR
jgi:hypothetical protein